MAIIKNIDKQKIINLLKEHPEYTLADVGRMEGISRERVRVIAGDIPGACRHTHLPRLCKNCGKLLRPYRPHKGLNYSSHREGFCADCWEKEKQRRKEERFKRTNQGFVCEICGKEFWRRNSAVKQAFDRGARVRFCSNECYGRFRLSKSRPGR